MMTWLCLLLLLVTATLGFPDQARSKCKNCRILGKDERAMFRAHSEACLAESGVRVELVNALLEGTIVEDPALKKHVYCILLKCKVISKDGKLQKAALLGKMAAKADTHNATKALESCFNLGGDTPEDLAWNLFRCGYERKAVLFDYMPTNSASSGDNENV